MEITGESMNGAKRVAGRYALVERIGAGGAGEVYRAVDEVTGHVVALKQLLRGQAGRRAKTLEALFEREYHTLARLKHPRIIEAYEYGFGDDGPYYTMELLEGRDLDQLRQLPVAAVCSHLRDVASSLALLHAGRLVHRDVSPRNVRVMADGTARLFDFGAVTSFGTSQDIVGTPAFMAPEVAHAMPLDSRTDLYSLGAVGYFCLTGRVPFPVKHASERHLFQIPPVPPSVLAPEVPPELDRLILWMLTYDPLGRPQTADAVIDELTVIGDLPPEPQERAERSYLLSSPIAGRAAELDGARARIGQALAGRGGEVMIEGPSGIGKTRLANEICLAGTLAGTVTLRADAESAPSRFGVAAALGLRLLEMCPDVARRCAGPHVAALRHISPDLADALGGVDSSSDTVDAVERRLRGHAGLREWFLAATRERTLLISVDNEHAADEDSAAFLVALGRESATAQLLLVTTARAGVAATVPETFQILRQRAHRVKLTGLDAAACEQLATGLFGGAMNAGRVGALLFARSGGVPRHLVELAELMAVKKIARYEGGGWVLPLELLDDELPARSEEVLAARLSGLSDDAIAFGETLAVHTNRVPLAVALALSELPTESRTHAAFAELLAAEVLVGETDVCRFRHEVVRQAIASRLDPEKRRAKLLRSAETLLAFEAAGVEDRVEAALLLIEAGEKRRGVSVLVGAAREFAAGAGTHHNPDPLVRALIRLVRAYDAEGCSDYELAALLFPLMPLAYYSARWRFLLEYGERALEIGIRITGLARAAELVPSLGPENAVKAGFGHAMAEAARHGDAAAGFDLKAAIAATIGIVPACAAVYTSVFDSEAAARIARVVAPLQLFGEAHLAHGMYLFAVAETFIQGNESQSLALWERALSKFEDPSCAALIGKARALALQGGALFTLGVLHSYRLGDTALETARRMEGLGVKAWAVAADQIRILYHSFRGESSEVEKYDQRVEANAVQGAQTSQAEVFWPALLIKADVLVGDAMAARRRCVQLERRAQELRTLKPQAEAARAAYRLLRGDVAQAIAMYEKLLPRFPIKQCVGWESVRTSYAKALNAAGEHGRARAVAEEIVAHMLPEDPDYAGQFLEAQRQLALSELGLGDVERAAVLLDALLARHGHHDNPLLIGLLHQARAEVAERAFDLERAERHRAEMVTRFRATKNPVLIAQCERTRRGGRRSAATHAPAAAFESRVGTGHAHVTSLNDRAAITEALGAAAEPYETALEILVRHTSAKSAHLYVHAGDALRLAWSTSPDAPPPDCVHELERGLAAARETVSGAAGDVSAGAIAGYRLIALQSAATGSVVGGVMLEAEGAVDLRSTHDFFEVLGRFVEEHGEDALGFVTG